MGDANATEMTLSGPRNYCKEIIDENNVAWDRVACTWLFWGCINYGPADFSWLGDGLIPYSYRYCIWVGNISCTERSVLSVGGRFKVPSHNSGVLHGMEQCHVQNGDLHDLQVYRWILSAGSWEISALHAVGYHIHLVNTYALQRAGSIETTVNALVLKLK